MFRLANGAGQHEVIPVPRLSLKVRRAWRQRVPEGPARLPTLACTVKDRVGRGGRPSCIHHCYPAISAKLHYRSIYRRRGPSSLQPEEARKSTSSWKIFESRDRIFPLHRTNNEFIAPLLQWLQIVRDLRTGPPSFLLQTMKERFECRRVNARRDTWAIW